MLSRTSALRVLSLLTLLLGMLLTPARSTQATATVLRADTFTRGNSTSGWGNASDGNNWGLLSGTAAQGGTVGIAGNKGTVAQSSSSLFNILGPAVNSPDQEGVVRWSVDSTSATAGILLRAQNSANYYMARYGGANAIQFRKVVNGVGSYLTAFSFTPIAGNFYWMRFRVQGSTITIKAWPDGSTESAAWGYTATDTSLSAPGGVGLYGYASTNTANTFDSFSVTDATALPPTIMPVPPTDTPTPASTATATPNPTPTDEVPSTAPTPAIPTATYTSVPTETQVPTDTPTPPVGTPTTEPTSAGNASLTVEQSSAGTTVHIDASNDGWQVFFNASQGGSITSIHEIDGGVHSELMQQAVLHAHVQSYVNVAGTFVSNQQPGAQISVLRNSPGVVGIKTVATNSTYHITWTYYYYLWPDGRIYVQVSIQNAGSKSLSLGTPDSVEINHDGLLLASCPDQAPYAWYATGGAVTSPIPSTIVPGEPDLFGRTPSAGAPTTLGSTLHKFTRWSDVGIISYGIRDFSGGTGGRAKEQWMGTLSSFPAGRTLTFQLLLNLRNGLNQAQSLSIDSDYRNPSITVSAGSPATSDMEPSNLTLKNGFNMLVGAYVINAENNHVNAQLNFPPGVTARPLPRFKINNWSKGIPTIRWGEQILNPGQDYNYTRDAATNTLYVQLNFDDVVSDAGPGQRANDVLDIS